MAKKPPTLNNDVPTLTATSSETRTADYYKLIEDQQKVITRMQEKIRALEAKVYELEGRINITQTVNSHLQNMVDAQEQYSLRPCLVINGMAKPGREEGADNSDDVNQVIETLERECRIRKILSRTILIKRTLLDGQTSMVSNLELLSSQRTALRRRCLENTSIAEILTLKSKNVVVSLYKLR